MRQTANHTTRFAPSPTGWLHLGHALAAISAYEAAGGGNFLLRIEDLDRGRCRLEFEAGIVEDLTWLGLQWQQPVLRQSERSEAHRAALATLDKAGLIYSCFCTRQEIVREIERAGEAPHRSGEVVYPGTCRTLSRSECEMRKARGDPFALRLDSRKAAAMTGALSFEELGQGPDGENGDVPVEPGVLGDIVLARKGLPAAYHLAVVVDDAFQDVSLVTRGNDLFASAHVQRMLQAALGLPAPLYAHHRLILDADGSKLSKRDRSSTLRNIRQQGIDAAEIRRRIGL
ncbi:MAG TPA: tRNA glutamyl-Q(34) synthetase GluQRS [Steroidobacteraceae bacterium]